MPDEVKLFNTLGRTIEKFQPITPSEVKLYCCGPTVYNYQHVGNLRTYVFEDVLAKTLRYAGYSVNHVMNITDVGHLVSDADDGEDKMAIAAKRENKKSHDIANRYTEIFFEHCDLLNIRRPNVICKATDHIQEMIDLIKQLEEKDIAYKSGGNVYFDVSKFPSYGDLAGLNLDDLKAGARITVDGNKRNPHDFALWFTKSKFENQELQWDSPWGTGYPGWHIECSAMAMRYLGDEMDIHCGGIDHIPVHHSNEIAQSEAASGKQFAKFWMHGGFLTSKAEKMSKSTGEFLTLDKLVERDIDPIAYRYFCYTASYRKELSWSWDALSGALNGLESLKSSVIEAKSNVDIETIPDKASSDRSIELRDKFKQAIFNDLNMPVALSVLRSAATDIHLDPHEKLSLLHEFDEVMSLGIKDWKYTKVEIPQEAQRLAMLRQTAREERNWQEADRLRDKLLDLGFTVKDSADGPVITGK